MTSVSTLMASSLPRWVTLLFVVAFALVAYLLYAGYSDRQAARKGMDDAERKTQALATELDKTNSRIADLKGQLDVTSQKLGLTQDELAQARHEIGQVAHCWERATPVALMNCINSSPHPEEARSAVSKGGLQGRRFCCPPSRRRATRGSSG